MKNVSLVLHCSKRFTSLEDLSVLENTSESLVMSHDLLESAALSLQLDAHLAPQLDDTAFDQRF
jgi:hypothetical protein